ncbi:Mgl repressor and galactose ultrainduction factor [Raoultella terrigena]|uniref:Mgl repressor and galactose ultrainduction factor n=1 Tax=Raoultella terrigena TaxID=577 RepID=A0A4U9D861_RAOTE|nr:Mgl repressor and galactose ultrainduction factor [Raoultella terrigena]
MSIQKIARLAGVSVATVSRVLNNSETVKAKNRERVLQAIEESNYQPNLLARQLRTGPQLHDPGDGLQYRQSLLRRGGEGDRRGS